MPLILLTLDQIVAGAIDRNNAAKTLEVSTRQVNKLMESWSVQRPLKNYLVVRAASNLKWDIRKTFAIDYIAGRETLENAAAGAGVSGRQMRRWVVDLLKEHLGIVFKDLGKLSEALRRSISRQILAGEEIDSTTQQKVLEIASGKVSIEDEALARVLLKRKKRRFRE